MPLKLPGSRLTLLFIFLACAALLAGALYLQYYQYLMPCPLCIFQRVAVIGVGLIALLGALHGRWQRGYALLTAGAAIAGAAIAGRHVLLQLMPASEVPACGPGLNYMLDTQPLGQVIGIVLRGTGECARIDWMLFGITLPGWSLLGFAGLLLLAVYAAWRSR